MPATHPSPSTVAAPAGGAGTPIRNMRVTFWGVQGSCPIFPTGREVTEYARRIATYTIERAVTDLAEKAARGEVTPEALRRLAAPETAAHYQAELGLPDLPVYGGETTCIEVETAEGDILVFDMETAEGDILVFDMGSGLREFSSQLLRKWAHRRNRTLHLFGSHEHLDHRSGLPFAGFCFARGEPFTLQLYGTHKFLQTLDERYGVFSQELSPSAHADDPLDYRMMAAKFVGTEIRRRMSPAAVAAAARTTAAAGNGDELPPWKVQDVSESIRIGATTVTPFEVYHGVTDCLAYKVRHGGATFVFSTDHELRHGEDPSDPRQSKSTAAETVLVEQCQDADLGYFDGQYFRAEYEGLRGIGLTPPVSRVGWGHGCIEDCIARARKCRIRRSLIGHHDPERQWDERVHLDRELGRMCDGEPCRIELAKQGQVMDL